MAIYDINGNVLFDDKKTDILTFNPKVKDLLLQAKRPINNKSEDSYLSETQPLVFLWFSDIHGNATALQRIMALREEYESMIDDTVCTGDMVRLRYNDGMAFWTGIEETENILITIGNHDMLGGTSGYDYQNQAVPQSTLYTTFFHPEEWDVTMESETTYYYKDYTTKNIRFIGLNCMLWDDEETAQQTWFANVLADAKTKGLSVIIGAHYCIGKSEQIKCNFTTIDKGAPVSAVLRDFYTTAIQDFVNNGGEFICCLAGHSHYNNFIQNQTYNNQRSLIIDAADTFFGNRYSDTQRTDGTKSQDICAFVVFDTASKAIKMIHVGADADHYLRPLNVLSYKYLTGEILADY